MNYLIKDSTLTEIADAIRSKYGSEDLIPVTEMAELITRIRTGAKPILESLTITPTGEEINEIPPFGSDGFGMVTVIGEPNLLPENILSGTTIYGVEGVLAADGGIDTSDATATEADIVEEATAYVNGRKIRGTHVCEADPILSVLYVMPTGEEFVEVPEEGVDGFSEVLVEGDPNLIPENILAGTTIYGVEGAMAFQSTEVTPGAEPIDLEPEDGFVAFDSVYIEGDSNLVPENIVEGVKIFGVEGSAMTEEDFIKKKLYPHKVVVPTFSDIVLYPEEEKSESGETITEEDKKYRGYAKVTVKGDPDLMPENIRRGVDIFGVIGTAIVDEDATDGKAEDRMFIFPGLNLIYEIHDE